MGVFSTIFKAFLVAVSFYFAGYLVGVIFAPLVNYTFYTLTQAATDMWGGVFPQSLNIIQQWADTSVNIAVWLGKGLVIFGAILAGWIIVRDIILLKYRFDIIQ